MNDLTNRVDPAPEIISRLSVDYAAIPAAIEDFKDQIGALPPAVSDKASHDAYVDLLTKIRASEKSTEASRVAEKDIYLKSERAVDGFFAPLKTDLGALMSGLHRKVETYLREKAEAERRERQRIADEERRKAEELRRAEQERLRLAEEARRAQTKAKHEDVAKVLGQEAERQEATAADARREAEVKPAELARTRSEQGTLSTLKSYWTFTVEDWDAIDLNALRAYVNRDALEKAIGAAVKIGVRDIPGVRIYQAEKAQVR